MRWMDCWAVRKGDFKLTNMNNQHGKGRPSDQIINPILDDKSLKLFNLNDDSGERNNLAESMPEKVQELKLAYENWIKENSGRY